MKQSNGGFLCLLFLHGEILCYQNDYWDVIIETYVCDEREFELDMIWERASFVPKAVISVNGKTTVFLLNKGKVEIRTVKEIESHPNQ